MTGPVPPKTILLVEDEALIAMNESAMLKKHGYSVITAYNAEKAIEAAKQDDIDLILMDIDLGHGRMDGTEAAEIILQEKDIPVVFLSSHTEPEVVEKTEGITSYGYIVKNSGETVLLASIKMAFRLFEANRQIKEREEALIHEKEKLREHIQIIEERKRIDEQQNKHLLELYEKMDFSQPDLLDYVLNASLEITNSRFAFTGLINEDESVMTIHRWSKKAMNNCSISEKPIEFPIEKAGIWGDCIRERQPVIINDYENDKRPTKHGTPAGHVEINRFLCVPIFDGNIIVAVGAVANKNIPYDIADADSLMMLYDKMWSLLKQQQADRRLQESEKKFRSIYEESPIGIELYNANGELIEVNQSCLDIFGVTDSDQLMGFNLFDDPNVTEEQKEKLCSKEKVRYEVAFELNKVKHAHLYETRKSGIIYLDVMITPLIENLKNKVRGYLVQVVDLTDRKQYEEELISQKQYLGTILQTSADGFWVVDSNRNITQVNDAYCRMSGYSKEELQHMTINDLDAGETSEATDARIQRIIQNGSEVFKAKHRRKDGSVFDVEISITFLNKHGGQFICFCRDITERNQAEKSLRESEVTFRTLIDILPVGVTVSNSEGKILTSNAMSQKLLGLSKEEQAQRYIDGQEWKIIRKDGSPMPADEYASTRAMKENRFIENVEMGIVKSPHETIWINVNSTPIPLEGYGVAIAYNDITEHVRIIGELKQERSFFTAIVENMPTMVFMKEAKNLTFYLVNKAAEETIGMKREELIGKSDYDIFPKHEADFFREKDLEVINSGNDVVIQEEELAASDQIRYVYTKKVPIFDEEGNPQYLLGISEDITEFKKALREKDYLMKELNHRVKNNLAMVSSLINLKKSVLGHEVDLSDLDNRINAIRLVHEKLYQTEDVFHINLKEYIHELNENVFSLHKRHVEIEEHIDDISLSTKTAIPLGLIINEIATNAMKHGFTAEGDVRFSVDLTEDKTKNQYTLIISNTGKPFPKDVTLDNPKTLGLQLLSALVGQLEGTIDLRREPHPVFTIRFPAEE